jgi:hypothetical protein
MDAMPNFFVIGAQKAGTTNLYHLLRQHPEVFMPEMKEPGYFHFVGSAGGVRWPNGTVTKQGVHDWDEYLQLYRNATGRKAVGDASTIYLGDPASAVRIKEASPDAKIVVMLRNPVDRAYSAYNYMRRNGKEPVERFEDAIALESERTAGGYAHVFRYVGRGFYAKQLRPWYELFPREQIGVWLFEDMLADPECLCSEIFEFLGVDNRFQIDSRAAEGGVQKNASGIPTGQLNAKLRSWVWGETALSSALKNVLPFSVRVRLRKGARRLLGSRGLTKPDTLSPVCRERLHALYREDIQDLETMLGRRMAAWTRQPVP